MKIFFIIYKKGFYISHAPLGRGVPLLDTPLDGIGSLAS
jgi:hypothetical protein